MKFLHSLSRSESEIEMARDREREVKMKKNLENSRETRISLVSGPHAMVHRSCRSIVVKTNLVGDLGHVGNPLSRQGFTSIILIIPFCVLPLQIIKELLICCVFVFDVLGPCRGWRYFLQKRKKERK